MSEQTQRELDLGYCEEAQTYCSIAEDRYQQGRADERKRITDILKDELESGYLLEKLLRRITND